MSKISIRLHTNKETGDINIKVKSECTLNELQASVGYLMAGLAANTNIENLEEMVKSIKEDMEKDNES